VVFLTKTAFNFFVFQFLKVTFKILTYFRFVPKRKILFFAYFNRFLSKLIVVLYILIDYCKFYLPFIQKLAKQILKYFIFSYSSVFAEF